MLSRISPARLLSEAASSLNPSLATAKAWKALCLTFSLLCAAGPTFTVPRGAFSAPPQGHCGSWSRKDQQGERGERSGQEGGLRWGSWRGGLPRLGGQQGLGLAEGGRQGEVSGVWAEITPAAWLQFLSSHLWAFRKPRHLGSAPLFHGQQGSKRTSDYSSDSFKEK